MSYIVGISREGERIALSDAERIRHVHIVGGIGTGKSKLLEHLIRQDIAAGRGLCLLDPHGTLADKIEKWCAVFRIGRGRTHIIRPGDAEFVPGFNPLRAIAGEDASVRVDYMIAACAQAWGVQSLSETPRLEKILRALFYVLLVRGLTLAEGPALLQARDPHGTRRALTTNLPDPAFQIIWDELNSLRSQEFSDHVESTITRLSKFLTSPAMRRVVGQRDKAIDFRAAMDRSEIVLINLSAQNAFSYENARVLGGLFINDLFLSCRGRDERLAKQRPFTLYIDEAYDFLSGDIEKILDQSRKWGLQTVLAHQRLGQLQERGAGIYNAVMAGTQTKVVLGGLSDDDAGLMAREVMRGEIDLCAAKPGLTAPVVIGEELIWLESRSNSSGTTSSSSRSSGTSIASGTTYSDSRSAPEYETEDGTVTAGSASSSVSTDTLAESDSVGSSSSATHGRSQAFRPIRELRPTHFYSLEESFHLAQVKLRELPDQTAIVKRRGMRTVEVRTVHVKSVIDAPRTTQRFRDKIVAASPYIASSAEAEAEITARRHKMVPTAASFNQANFWHEER